jgi:hypothetical protein
MDTNHPYDDDLARFAVAFMRAVIAWNNAENTARKILLEFGGRGIGLRIAAEHLGSRAMKEALLTLCDALHDPELAPSATELGSHVAHFVEGMDTLRAYRNFYVHSLRFTSKSPDDPTTFRGFLHSVEARGRLAFVEQHLTTGELEKFMFNTMVLEGYGKAISRAMPNSTSLADLLPGNEPPPLSSLEKPLWPEKLKKHRSYLGER